MSTKATNKILNTDSYKAGHAAMYPPAKRMVAYGEFRKSYPLRFTDHRIVFYGFNYIVENFLNKKWTAQELEEAISFMSSHNVAMTAYPFPKDLFNKFINENGGYFPVKIQALPEGQVIYPHVPVYQITATHEYARLVTYLETILTQVWYQTTVCTLSRHVKTIIKNAFHTSVDPENHFLLNSRLHDFGYRGCTSNEQAMIGGSAHLVNFDGTDTLVAAAYAHERNNNVPFAQSIPATEHSVMTAWPDELSAVRNMIEHFGHGVFACVADSYNYEAFLKNVLPKVAYEVKAKGGTMVVRPDSGEPVQAVLQGLNACAAAFGYTYNKKGYKVLNNSAVIQGDGIDINIVYDILNVVHSHQYSAQNVAFGMGAGLLQKINRDTMSFATKLCHIEYQDGTRRDVMKDPKTDQTKMSLPGVLKVFKNGNTLQVGAEEEQGTDLLQTVYDHGPVDYKKPTMMEIRSHVEQQMAEMPEYQPHLPELLSPTLAAKIAAQRASRS